MQQKPKTAAEYQAEMMQLYRRAHPTPETITESSTTPPETAVPTAPIPPTNVLQPALDLPPASDSITTPKPEPSATLPENLPPLTETPQEPTSELPPLSDATAAPESEPSAALPENLPPPLTEIPQEPTSELPPLSDATAAPEPEAPAAPMNAAMPTPEPSPFRPTPAEPFPSQKPEESTPIIELEPVPKIPPNTAYGFLKVITRTGSEALPLPNVTVTVTAMEGANSRLYFSGITNESGETDHIPLPAPELNPNASPTNRQLYQNYDVTVYHPDYFRMESRGLPIFPGITSLQKFAMIPLPQRPGENPPTVVYENTEPRFPD